MKCPNCNGPTIPGFLVSSFYCKNECDLKSGNSASEIDTSGKNWLNMSEKEMNNYVKGGVLYPPGTWNTNDFETYSIVWGFSALIQIEIIGPTNRDGGFSTEYGGVYKILQTVYKKAHPELFNNE